MSDGITLHNPSRFPIASERLLQASRAVLARHPTCEDSSLSIALTDSETIRALNLQFAQVDSPTDALSFRAGAVPLVSGEPERYLGDIVIAHDYASAQARATGTAISDVLCLLIIHGTLHLLGYDHDTKAAQDKMWTAQDHALRAIGIDRALVDQYGKIEND